MQQLADTALTQLLGVGTGAICVVGEAAEPYLALTTSQSRGGTQALSGRQRPTNYRRNLPIRFLLPDLYFLDTLSDDY